MSDFKTRLEDEHTELEKKRNALAVFIKTDKFEELNFAQRFLLIKQLNAMKDYSEILAARLSII